METLNHQPCFLPLPNNDPYNILQFSSRVCIPMRCIQNTLGNKSWILLRDRTTLMYSSKPKFGYYPELGGGEIEPICQ